LIMVSLTLQISFTTPMYHLKLLAKMRKKS
jgi:hypothetical protein